MIRAREPRALRFIPILVLSASLAALADDAPVATRPAVPGTLSLHLRQRDKQTGLAAIRDAQWQTAETAIIICDMWDDHYCKSAAQRVGVMAPKMNAAITVARNHGVMIIHAPSGCMDQYDGTPCRLRMQQAPLTKPPVEIVGWCYLDPAVEPEMPVDTSVCPCDDPVVGEAVKVFTKQHPAIDITGYDGVSDNGVEIYNFCAANGIKNIILMGVHTNMCVLGRPFGIRQQVRLGMNVALCRDLTDAMYDPRQPPYVSHTRGTELVVEHIEKYWCPSIESADLMSVVEGSADPATLGRNEKAAGGR
jgi:nicotinamidase-related amidase